MLGWGIIPSIWEIDIGMWAGVAWDQKAALRHSIYPTWIMPMASTFLLGWATLPVLKREGIDLSRNV